MEINGICSIDIDGINAFDGWLTLGCIYNRSNDHRPVGSKICFPFKKTSHLNKFVKAGGKMSLGCRIGKGTATFAFEFEKQAPVSGKTIGVDIGFKNTVTTSDGFATKRNEHGQDLEDVCKKVARKKKGSKGFKRAQEHRKNFINWSVNQLNLDGISEVRREDIKDLRKFKRISKVMTAWTYTNIFGKLDRYCEERNVSVVKVPPAYTSQRCSACGWTRSSNREGKEFKCEKCGNALDADLNASRNLAANLRYISTGERLRRLNRTGFFWEVVS
jgi:transposase